VDYILSIAFWEAPESNGLGVAKVTRLNRITAG